MGTLRSYVGTIIRELRQSAGLTQDELAAKAGWDTPKLVSEYERGSRNATLDTVDRLLKALGVERYDVLLRATKGTRKVDAAEEAFVKAMRRVDPAVRPLVLALVKTAVRWSRRGRRTRR